MFYVIREQRYRINTLIRKLLNFQMHSQAFGRHKLASELEKMREAAEDFKEELTRLESKLSHSGPGAHAHLRRNKR